nr:hypothetical protein [Kibdelosporangium sp. MJ126-NF4]
MEWCLRGLLWLAVLFRLGTAVVVLLAATRVRRRDGAGAMAQVLVLDLVGGLAGVVLATAVAQAGEQLVVGILGSGLLIHYAVTAARQLQPK